MKHSSSPRRCWGAKLFDAVLASGGRAARGRRRRAYQPNGFERFRTRTVVWLEWPVGKDVVRVEEGVPGL